MELVILSLCFSCWAFPRYYFAVIRAVFVWLGEKRKEKEDQRCKDETGSLIIASSKSSRNKSHMTCVGTCLIFSSVWRLFDLLSLSYPNEPLGVSCSNMWQVVAVPLYIFLPLLPDIEFSGLHKPPKDYFLFCLAIGGDLRLRRYGLMSGRSICAADRNHPSTSITPLNKTEGSQPHYESAHTYRNICIYILYM